MSVEYVPIPEPESLIPTLNMQSPDELNHNLWLIPRPYLFIKNFSLHCHMHPDLRTMHFRTSQALHPCSALPISAKHSLVLGFQKVTNIPDQKRGKTTVHDQQQQCMVPQGPHTSWITLARALAHSPQDA